MSRSEAIEQLKRAQTNEHRDDAHVSPDEVLCKLLSGLGYEDVVEEYQRVRKWYS